MSQIGPSLPPHLRRQHSEDSEDSEDDVEGPRLPREPCLGPPPASAEDGSSSSEDDYGPSLPPGFQTRPAPPAAEDNHDADDDGEGLIGPRVEEKSEASSGASGVREEVEERARRMKDRLENKDTEVVKRETWMLELPEEKADRFGLGPRQFSRKGVSERGGDRSKWTDTPQEKARKAALGIADQEQPEEKEEVFARMVTHQRDAAMAKVADSLKQKRGDESLMEMHDKKMKKKKEEEGAPQERRPFDRDLDLKANQFDAAAKKAMLKKAAKINDRFSSDERTIGSGSSLAGAKMRSWSALLIFLGCLHDFDAQTSGLLNHSASIKLRNSLYFATELANDAKDTENKNEMLGPQSQAGTDSLFLLAHTSSLGLYLQGVADQELATPLLQSLLDQLPYSVTNNSATSQAKAVATSIAAKMTRFSSLLTSLKEEVEQTPSYLLTPRRCCSLPAAQFRHDSSFRRAILTTAACEASSLPHVSGQVSTNLTSLLERHLGQVGVRWQYLVRATGSEVLHPAPLSPTCGPAPHSHLLLPTLHPATKLVVLVMDASTAVSAAQFHLVSVVTAHLLTSLSPHDQVSVVVMSPTSHTLTTQPEASCLEGRLLPLLPQLQENLLQQVRRQEQAGGSAHLHAGLVTALGLLANSSSWESAPAQVVFMSSAPQLQRAEATILATLASLPRQRRVQVSAVIVQDTLENISPLLTIPHHTISSVSSIGPTLVNWYRPSSPHPLSRPKVFPPVYDPVSGDRTVALTLPVTVDGEPAIVGVDVDLHYLAEEVLFRPREKCRKLFLVDSTGNTIAHPRLGERIENIRSLEASADMDSLYHRLLTVPSGEEEVGGSLYTWHRVENSPYVVVVAQCDNYKERRLLPVSYSREGADFQYHALILAGTSKLCRHLREVASMQAASLYLSPSAFTSPYDQLRQDTVPLRAQSFMAFLTDPTRLIANPGLRSSVRQDTSVVARLTSHWRRQAEISPLNNYIVRRRVATPHGVLLSYPGVRSSTPEMDPTATSWYQVAIAQAPRLVVSVPHLDTGGAGYVVTVTQAVAQGNSSLKQGGEEAAVVAADFTMGYFYKIMNDSIPRGVCSSEGVRCFLVEHGGYLVAHPALAQGGGGRAEARHITQMEPLVASELLSRPAVMMKSVCLRPEDGTLQRHFSLQVREGEVVSSEAGSCTHWQLAPVPGTNLFLGVVREQTVDCQKSPAFCWCSTVDRTCLDCNRVEQDECECPCECRQRQSVCAATDAPPSVPLCSPVPPPAPSAPRHSTVRVERLPPCVHTDCQARSSQGQCYGVLGCAWCHTAEDGSLLSSPFCSRQETCYSGVLASASPYSLVQDPARVSLRAGEADRSLLRASPIGPVAGGIMAFFVLLAATAWGYRHWSTTDRRLLSSTGSSLRISQLEEEAEVPRTGHHNYGLHGDLGAASVVSPYRMNPGYRRPRPAVTDSDHGYSTMTPFGDQDSEIISCLDEARDPRLVASGNPLSLQSMTSGVSSRAPSPQGEGTREEPPEHQRLMPSGACDVIKRSAGDVMILGNGGDIYKHPANISKNRPSDVSVTETNSDMTMLPHQMVVAAVVHMVDT